MPFEPLGGEIAVYCPTYSGNASDLIGSNDGLEVGGVAYERDRAKGGVEAWKFNELDASVDISGWWRLTDHPVGTVSVWAILDTGSSIRSLFSARDGGGNTRLAMDLFGNADMAFGAGEKSNAVVAGSSAFNLGQWNHLVSVWDNLNNELNVYINGEFHGTGTYTASGGVGSRDFRIGSFYTGALYFFDNRIDDFRLFDRKLTKPEIDEIYKRGYQRGLALGSPLGAWIPSLDRFGRKEGNTAVDLSGQGNVGALSVGAGYLGKSFDLSADTIDFTSVTATTISLWFNGTGTNTLFGNSVNTNGISIASTTQINVDFGAPLAFTVPTISAGWHHLAVKQDGGNKRLFLDGVESSTGPIGDVNPMAVDRIGGNSTPSWVGQIDDVRVYDTSLSDSKIADLATARGYQEVSGVEPSYNALLGQGLHIEDPDLAAVYRQQESTPNGKDAAALNRDATVNGGVTQLTGPTGYLPNAYKYNGADGQLVVPIEVGIADSFSVASWLYKVGTARRFVVGGNPASDMYYESGTKWAVGNSGEQTGGPSNNNAWVHRVLSFIGGNAQHHLDGSADGAPVSGITYSTPTALRIGSSAIDADWFNDRIAETSYWTDALSETEVSEIFSGPEPLCLNVPSLDAQPQVGVESTVTLQQADWIIDPSFAGDNGTISWELAWYVADDQAGTGETLRDTTTAPAGYTPTGADVDKYLRCRVRGSNLGGYDEREDTYTAYSQVLAGAGTPPVNTVPPVVSGTEQVGEILSCTTGTWTGDPVPTYTYQWQSGDQANGSDMADIVGATQANYELQAAEADKYVRCVVTATNTAGSDSEPSNIVGPITGPAPAFKAWYARYSNTQLTSHSAVQAVC